MTSLRLTRSLSDLNPPPSMMELCGEMSRAKDQVKGVEKTQSGGQNSVPGISHVIKASVQAYTEIWI